MNIKKIKKNLRNIYNNTMQCNNTRPTCSYLMHTNYKINEFLELDVFAHYYVKLMLGLYTNRLSRVSVKFVSKLGVFDVLIVERIVVRLLRPAGR